MTTPLSVLALASEFKGTAFLETCRARGCKVSLLVETQCAAAQWPWESLSEHWSMPDLHRQPDVLHAVSFLTRTRHFDRIVALDDYDVETAAQLREHLCIEGMRESAARLFRDKLAMRTRAAAHDIRVPAFTGLFNDAAVRAFLAEIPAPWVLKPRSLAGSDGVRVFHDADALWKTLEQMGDRRSHHLLEQFIAGQVFHVDSLCWDDAVVFASASRYGTPPLQALQGRGVFTSQVLPRDSDEAAALLALNVDVQRALIRGAGVSHTEFIRRDADGQWFFLETAARVGGGNIDRLVEAATGVHLWREAAHIEVAMARGESYAPPPLEIAAAGLIACPIAGRSIKPELLDAPEVVMRTRTGEFLVIIVQSDDPARVAERVDAFSRALAGV